VATGTGLTVAAPSSRLLPLRPTVQTRCGTLDRPHLASLIDSPLVCEQVPATYRSSQSTAGARAMALVRSSSAVSPGVRLRARSYAASIPATVLDTRRGWAPSASSRWGCRRNAKSRSSIRRVSRGRDAALRPDQAHPLLAALKGNRAGTVCTRRARAWPEMGRHSTCGCTVRVERALHQRPAVTVQLIDVKTREAAASTNLPS